MTKKLPRGHAYMRFRNDGYSIHVDFPEKKVPWLDKVIKQAMKAYAKDEEDYLSRGVTKGIGDE